MFSIGCAVQHTDMYLMSYTFGRKQIHKQKRKGKKNILYALSFAKHN